MYSNLFNISNKYKNPTMKTVVFLYVIFSKYCADMWFTGLVYWLDKDKNFCGTETDGTVFTNNE